MQTRNHLPAQAIIEAIAPKGQNLIRPESCLLPSGQITYRTLVRKLPLAADEGSTAFPSDIPGDTPTPESPVAGFTDERLGDLPRTDGRTGEQSMPKTQRSYL